MTQRRDALALSYTAAAAIRGRQRTRRGEWRDAGILPACLAAILAAFAIRFRRERGTLSSRSRSFLAVRNFGTC